MVVDVQLEQIVPRELIDVLLVLLDLILDAGDLLIAMAVQSSPQLLDPVHPDLMSDVRCIMGLLLHSNTRHQVLIRPHLRGRDCLLAQYFELGRDFGW